MKAIFALFLTLSILSSKAQSDTAITSSFEQIATDSAIFKVDSVYITENDTIFKNIFSGVVPLKTEWCRIKFKSIYVFKLTCNDYYDRYVTYYAVKEDESGQLNLIEITKKEYKQ